MVASKASEGSESWSLWRVVDVDTDEVIGSVMTEENAEGCKITYKIKGERGISKEKFHEFVLENWGEFASQWEGD